MVTAFLDTSVIVDLLRNHHPALAWQQRQQGLSLTRAVWMEVMIGAQDKRHQLIAIRLINTFANYAAS